MKAVLVTRFSALGDVALAVPALYNACRANPDTQFVMLTKQHAAGIFANPPSNLVIETPDLNLYKGAGGLLRLWRELHKRYRFTTVVDLHDVLRTKMLRCFARFSGVKVSHIHKGRRAKKALTRTRGKVLVPLTSTVERYRSAFSRAGIELGDVFRSVFQEKEADPLLFAPASAPKQSGEYWLAVAPFARHAGKIYPMHLMEKVVAHFAAKPRARIFVFGFGAEEEGIIAGWQNKYPAVVNMASLRLGISAEMNLLSYCDCMLSMDSANMHLASLVGLRTVSVWGSTHPYTGFMGWHQKDSDAVQLEMTCRPCSVFGNKPCRRGDYHCLNGISPNLIIDRIEK